MEGARAEAPRDKKMKKFFKIIATVIIAIVALSATTLAAEHEHDWEMFGQNSNSFQVICDDCGTFVSVPTNELACQHEFVTENTATNLCMTRCTKCDYNVQGNHTLEMYVSSKSHGLACITCGYLVSSEEHEWADHDFANNAHIIECTVCGYEETHTATQKGKNMGNTIIYGIEKTALPVSLFIYVCSEGKQLYFQTATPYEQNRRHKIPPTAIHISTGSCTHRKVNIFISITV